MPTYRLTVEYEGTRYSGWQAQGNTQKTIQGHLLRAAQDVLGEVDIGGAGRTDAGVHAAAQVAHLRSHKTHDPLLLARKLNDLLPHDISVLDAVRTRDNFHARHDATSRVYLYQIATRRTAFAKPFVWWIKDRLDFEAMQNVAASLAGRHDFSAFTDKRLKEEDSRIVVVERAELVRDGDLILFRIAASHYLWKMVRKLTSFLVEVGRGNERGIEQRLHARAEPWQPTAPPSGLFLEAITYEGETFERPLQAIVPVERFRRAPAAVETARAVSRDAPPAAPPRSRGNNPRPKGYAPHSRRRR
jgi:tRNA pseudouridine38-40 synthase